MKSTIQISPFGVFEKIEADGKRKVQNCDAVALAAVVADWKRRGSPKILLDYLHKRGEAAGWFTALRVDPLQGLLGDCEFTPDGAKAITDGVYRFPSPDWSAGSDGRPFCLHTVGLTNTPAIPVKPILNSAGPAGESQNNKPQKENPKMEKIKTLLGLPPEADEAAVEAAVQALLNKLNDAVEASLKSKGEGVAAANADRIQNSAEFVAAYIQSPNAVEAALKALKPVATQMGTRIINSQATRTPAQVASVARKFATKAEAKTALAAQPVGSRKAFFAEHEASFAD